ncbi:hypothetical protein TNCV_5062991 [Trichonephila clavipes]|nr:hypothetical protein TNCV_5062991 [Trichonephila clavipes]
MLLIHTIEDDLEGHSVRMGGRSTAVVGWAPLPGTHLTGYCNHKNRLEYRNAPFKQMDLNILAIWLEKVFLKGPAVEPSWRYYPPQNVIDALKGLSPSFKFSFN